MPQFTFSSSAENRILLAITGACGGVKDAAFALKQALQLSSLAGLVALHALILRGDDPGQAAVAADRIRRGI